MMYCAKDFEVDDIISLNSLPVLEKPDINKEIERGKKICADRHKVIGSVDEGVQPLYKRKRKTTHTGYYKLFSRYYEGDKRIIPKCKHTGNCIIDRDILTRYEHDVFLAQPQIKKELRPGQYRFHYERKTYLPSSFRCEELAIPKKIRMQNAWNDYGRILAPRQTENLVHMLYGGVNISSINHVMELCRDERIKQAMIKKRIARDARKIRSKIRRRQKKMVKRIAINFFEILKDFLTKDVVIGNDPVVKNISNIIAEKIMNGGGYGKVDRDAENILAKCVYSLADNLAVWIQKILEITDFGPLSDRYAGFDEDSCVCPKKLEYEEYPIDDYISYRTISTENISWAGSDEYEFEMLEEGGEEGFYDYYGGEYGEEDVQIAVQADVPKPDDGQIVVSSNVPKPDDGQIVVSSNVPKPDDGQIIVSSNVPGAAPAEEEKGGDV